MAKFKKIIVAGPLVVETIYPAPNPRDTVGVRAGKKSLSSEAQQRMNLACAQVKVNAVQGLNARKLNLNATHFQNVLFGQE